MCNSLICELTDWLIFIGLSWLGLLTLIVATVLFWQMIKLLVEDFKNND